MIHPVYLYRLHRLRVLPKLRGLRAAQWAPAAQVPPAAAGWAKWCSPMARTAVRSGARATGWPATAPNHQRSTAAWTRQEPARPQARP